MALIKTVHDITHQHNNTLAVHDEGVNDNGTTIGAADYVDINIVLIYT